MKPALSFVLLLAAMSAAAALQAAQPDPKSDAATKTDPYTRTETTTLRAKIESIDPASRTVAVRNREGNLVNLTAGPEFEHFDRLKVGDEVTLRYIESVALQIHRRDQPDGTAGSRGQTIRGAEAGPAGTRTRQVTKTVTIDAVDPDAEFITFTDQSGRRQSLHPENRDLLKDLHPGDRVDITYTTALLLSVE